MASAKTKSPSIVETDIEASASQGRSASPDPTDAAPLVHEGSVPDGPDSVFSPARTGVIVFIATLAAFISPMTANIFLPALPEVARDLNVTTEKINLAVFVYMIAQGISPLFLGGSDALGRRSIYLICFIIYSGANAGLANLANGDFAGLLVLRFMQACGSASMIAIGAGVVNDVCSSKNRGSFMSIVQAGSTLGPAIGPVLGGILAQGFGWRGIFWFTFILGALVLALVVVFLPETLAKARANRAIPILIRKAWIDLCLESRAEGKHDPASLQEATPTSTKSPHQSWRQRGHHALQACWTPFRALYVVGQPEIFLALVAFALPFACFYGLTVPLSSQFELRYGLSTLQSGLVFLAPGTGVSLGALISGRLLDRSFRKVQTQFDRERLAEDELEQERRQDELVAGRHDSVPSTDGRRDSHHTVVVSEPVSSTKARGLTKEEMTALFPLERARLEYYPHWTALMVVGFIGYGWTLNYNVYIAVPILFTFLQGFACGGQFGILGCVLVDYAGGKGASITAVNNLFRCLSGAVVSAVVQYIINGVGVGWTQTIFAFISLLAAGITLVMYRLGPGWRRSRFEAAAAKTRRRAGQVS
ncbi:unnamed protein product [Tilletia controversa]|uniref:Major facilitator superfamily (MFS) profile domain-containing protein n=3 Tax=Tilletia TaxID=13289 RepID=A0A8X7MVP4_9BASI|nr:hypothetical protein CF336_g2789 [Tilletia laevis]KAE8201815.1 hypothetical protein CF328_g2567 [Tilletia controversa]KAE8262849.1 hypothetical protein A4X03_0g2131 [Tilletia caries]KAE8206322.1 hypothetical protein CF335_g1979 [Tilletia laevis]KAE8248828.1 hypothetical protein A4X06_0g3506 [Tilletia controversa]